MEQHDSDHGDGAQALDVGAELVIGNGMELMTYGAPPGDVGGHPITQVDTAERWVLPGRAGDDVTATWPAPRRRVDLHWPPRHPPTVLLDRWWWCTP